jgi:hypothetical protein
MHLRQICSICLSPYLSNLRYPHDHDAGVFAIPAFECSVTSARSICCPEREKAQIIVLKDFLAAVLRAVSTADAYQEESGLI